MRVPSSLSAALLAKIFLVQLRVNMRKREKSGGFLFFLLIEAMLLKRSFSRSFFYNIVFLQRALTLISGLYFQSLFENKETFYVAMLTLSDVIL